MSSGVLHQGLTPPALRGASISLTPPDPAPVSNPAISPAISPAVNPAIRIAADEFGYLAWDPVADRLHELNATGALILELCNGIRSTDEIRALASPILP